VRVLVLGGTGFVGGAAVRRLMALGHDVAAFHRGDSSGGAETVHIHIRGDRKDLAAHRDEFRRFGPEVVLDTIAYTEADGRSLAAALGGIAARFVVLSSQDVYAPYGRLLRLESGPVDRAASSEESALRSSRHPYRAMAKPGEMAYDYEKILVETAVREASGVPVTILRLPMVYGPGDPQRRLRPYLGRMAEGVSEIRLDGAKAAWRCTRGFVEDVAEAITLAVTDHRASGRVYNVGEDDALREAEWIQAIGEAVGWKGFVRTVEKDELPEEEREPYDFAHDLVANTSRIRRELGFREGAGRGEGLRRSVASERTERAG
jgi:nucleoside-diphosphate-sugar epimerase